jgi:hypothetical protein
VFGRKTCGSLEGHARNRFAKSLSHLRQLLQCDFLRWLMQWTEASARSEK